MVATTTVGVVTVAPPFGGPVSVAAAASSVRAGIALGEPVGGQGGDATPIARASSGLSPQIGSSLIVGRER